MNKQKYQPIKTPPMLSFFGVLIVTAFMQIVSILNNQKQPTIAPPLTPIIPPLKNKLGIIIA